VPTTDRMVTQVDYRENDVRMLLRRGKSKKEIARDLGITIEAVGKIERAAAIDERRRKRDEADRLKAKRRRQL
jgi:hypothetical protein